jgi:hypothetical protein
MGIARGRKGIEFLTNTKNQTPLLMNKYIQDSIRNNLRSVVSGLTVPQQKAVAEMVRGLFTAGEPILRHLAQYEEKTAKKQGEKYSYHLGNIDIAEKVSEIAIRKTKYSVRKRTVIAYDLTDIAKESSKKIEKLTTVFDGSKRRPASGFLLHGVGIDTLLTKLEVHDNTVYTTNQIRKRIVEEISNKLDHKGIWVFDRGNDDKQFFKYLRQTAKVEFIARLKENRQVVIKKTGELIQVKHLKPNKYEVYLMNRNNNKVDTRYVYTLIISNHLEDHEPIRLISSLPIDTYSSKEFVTIYLERWGVENIFKRAKTKFYLEKIRVLKYRKFVNLVALIQLAVLVSTLTFIRLQQSTNAVIIGVLMAYRKFIKHKSLSFNLDSFITFMQQALKPLCLRIDKPPNQLNIFSKRALGKLGLF